MAVETDDDRAALLADFGQAGSYTHAGATVSMTGIFTGPYVSHALGHMGVEFEGGNPAFLVRSIDLPAGAVQGDTLVTGGTTYNVRSVQPDGTGMTKLALELMS
ncbi:MAG TPA: head-tail joining protein [Reyranella sp.]|jgi:hypothetical protein|nr:head-tail joining protein [Reyranella sp.]